MSESIQALFRQCIVASPGCKLIDIDLVSAEALVTGWLAKDESYKTLALAGTHKYAMAKYLKIPVSLDMPLAELKKALKPVKDINPRLYRQIKCAVYGGNYLQSARGLYRSNPGDFSSEKEAAEFQKFLKGISPKVETWKAQVVKEAEHQKYLTNPFGYRRDFWDLPGGDGPKAVAFKPSSIVAAAVKEMMLQIWDTDAGQYMIMQTHDSLTFDVPETSCEDVIGTVKLIITQPWPQLDGLSFDCSIEVSDCLQ